MEKFPFSIEDFVRTAARLLASRGARSEVRIVAGQVPEVNQSSYDSWDGGLFGWSFSFSLPMQAFSAITKEDRRQLETNIKDAMNEILESNRTHGIDEVVIKLALDKAEPDWRNRALRWAEGSGVTNQGRARSDNIAPLQYEGLVFRSAPEICLFRALKALDVTVAPLPVFVRGGNTYRRLEPDFVLIRKSTMMVVEVDGEWSHQESPVVAHERLAVLLHEGVKTERIRAAD